MRGWSPEEDEMLLQLIETSGKRWKLIAEALGNSNPRTPAMVRNRYLRIERGRWLTEQGMSKNRCGQCGQLKRGHVCQAPRALVNPADQGTDWGKESVPSSPYTPLGKLSLGAPPLTYVSYGNNDESLSLFPSPADLNGTCRTPQSLAGIMGSSMAGPPGLRPQSSFDILLRASEMRSTEVAPEQPKILADTPSVLPGELINPFRSVASENPCMLSAADIEVADVATGGCATAELGRRTETFVPNASRRVEVEG